MLVKRFKTRSVEGTLNLGPNMVEKLMPTPKLILLRGELGAGKTTLVKGIANALTGVDPEEVTSPTFTLVHEYQGTKAHLYHLDLYRLEKEEELAALGIEEMVSQPDALVLVEWGDKFQSVINMASGQIMMRANELDEREIFLEVL
ncbi:tRNA (adenosine(37)-N6)-threonylcarbamoyltransferase complex ATPase subunit type 1 TsaE [Terriglobus tenax]|uniref:tRNA (adenosine(37)-N6)-threonylcarbamoyltransferase complex ATPase subunit type 1 TsaE n=1 Tax=Terriglobus tenax TaxID=1111115 RepID=UPI0021DFCA76|nr:tRNA (adenosine(37)-N6)-threonylcarbamoyltransferase complex ATPase subunit type 1 TsaE [Terriglobus tenax]